jgi:NAD(P)-dependent dehydrogenase (short-subunit alcohol dehydrogenase family)
VLACRLPPGSRIVLLTGASSGIGRESALGFARLGDTVVGVASHEPALRELAEQQPGIEVEVCDLMVAEERAALVAGCSSGTGASTCW